MKNETSTLLEVLKIIIPSFLAAGIALYITTRRRKFDTTLTLHKEFNTGEILKARSKAETLLSKYPKESYKDFRKKISDEERDQIWTIIHFYQRLYISITEKEVRRSMIVDLFGEIFVQWWYIPFLQHFFVKTGYSSGKRMELLNEWFMNNTDSHLYNSWVKGGTDFLNTLVIKKQEEDRKSEEMTKLSN